MLKIIIIEDEGKAARELEKIIKQAVEAVEILAIIPSVAASIHWLETNLHPDLIFSDIQLADGLSFDIFRNTTVNVPIIFCTAFDQYAIKAFEANSLDYLLKPIEEDNVKSALDKYLGIKNFYESTANSNQEKNVRKMLETFYNSKNNYQSTLLVYQQDKIIPIKTEDINFIYATDRTVRVFCAKEKIYFIRQTLDALEQKLSSEQFYKANRQFIINRNCIDTVYQYFGRKLLVKTICATPENIVISKERSQDFLSWMES